MLRPYGVPKLDKTFQSLSSDVRDEMNSGKCHLLIDYAHEGFSWWMFERIYNALDTIALPHEQVVLLSGDFNVDFTHARYIQEYHITNPIRAYPLNYFKNLIGERLSSPRFSSECLAWSQLVEKRTRSKLFLNLNRRNRLHRIVTVVQLQQRDLLDLGFVSLPDKFEGRTNEEAIEDEGTRYGVSTSLMRDLRVNYLQLKPLLPLRVDVDAMMVDQRHLHPTWPYLETWMSLVSESLFFESSLGQVFLSEKIWEPMVKFHPFLLIGDANSLATLRCLSFRTFHPYINETYDSVLDHEQRLNMVLDELQRLSMMPEENRYKWFMGMKDALIHNYETLKANKFADCRFPADLVM